MTTAEAYAAGGALVRVFEKGSSFERMCKLLGGQFLLTLELGIQRVLQTALRWAQDARRPQPGCIERR